MKRIITILVLITSMSVYAQLDQIPGVYFRQHGSGPHIIEYTLTLRENGTFLFHFHRNVEKPIPQEEHKYGKGKWTIEVKENFSTNTFIISFSANPEKDFDEKFTLDFNGSKARFVNKTQRNITDKEVQTRLQFYKSNIFWMERIAIYKQTK